MDNTINRLNEMKGYIEREFNKPMIDKDFRNKRGYLENKIMELDWDNTSIREEVKLEIRQSQLHGQTPYVGNIPLIECIDNHIKELTANYNFTHPDKLIDVDKVINSEFPDIDNQPANYGKTLKLIKSCVSNDIPVYLTGPAGCGKSYMANQVAKELNLDFYPMNAIQQEFQIRGYTDLKGAYNATNFSRAFVDGGLLLLDEMDASIPEVLVILNYAIANKKFEFPLGDYSGSFRTPLMHNQSTFEANKNFKVIAAGNTIGKGSDGLYTGRYRLDAASLNRFVFIQMDYDKSIEFQLANKNEFIVKEIHNIRSAINDLNLDGIVSYRQIEYITKLMSNGVGKDTAFDIAIYNQFDSEDAAKLKSSI